MGFLTDLKAIYEIQKIRKGKVGTLSISQMVVCMVNLFDAKKNLSSYEFEQVYELFNKLRLCKTKRKMDIIKFSGFAKEIIKRFDAIAPYELYNGENKVEILPGAENNSSKSITNNYYYMTKEEFIIWIDQINDIDEAELCCSVLTLCQLSGRFNYEETVNLATALDRRRKELMNSNIK